MPKRELALKNSTLLAAYLIIVWGFYRILFKLPEEIEELIIKPVIWLVPIIFLLKKEKVGLGSLGITFKNLFPAVYLSLSLGILFALEGLVINFIKYNGLEFSANIGESSFFVALSISVATAISEEIAFRGYFFNRILYVLKKEWTANIISSFIWALVHVPVAIFWWELNFPATIGYLILTTIFGIGSAFVFARTKNVASSILLHIMWEWPIILFR